MAGRRKFSPDSILQPKLLDLRFAIEWLMDMGVPATRLASLFQTTPGNIRQLKYLAPRLLDPSLITIVPSLDLIPSTQLHRGVGLRSHREILRRSSKLSATTQWLEETIELQYERHCQAADFRGGMESLIALKQKLGHLSEVRRIAAAGVLDQHLSWFAVHSGLARSAVSYASRSMWLLQTAFYRRNDVTDAKDFVKSALIASHANLLSGRPAATLQILDLASEAAKSISAPLGSDHHRQRGVAYFQLGRSYDREARNCFSRAEIQMRRLGEATTEAQVKMTAARYLNLLGQPDWENAQEMLAECSATFAPDSLEMSMNRHWAAACGLSTDSAAAHARAQEFIESNRQPTSRFGHQATILKLLSITPDLGLSKGLQSIWIRKALYQNAFRFK